MSGMHKIIQQKALGILRGFLCPEIELRQPY